MNKRELPVGDLRLGMYVVELDRPWLGTPFDFQGFPLTHENQIDQLKLYCQIVYVDPERMTWAPPPPPKRKPVVVVQEPVRGSTVYAEVTPVEKEVIVAREIYKSCEEAITYALENLHVEGEID